MNAKSPTEKSGVGGWLLLLCISLAVLNPLGLLRLVLSYVTLFRTTDSIVMSYGAYRIGVAVLAGLYALIGLMSLQAGIAMWRIQPRAVTYTRRFLVLAIVVSVAQTALPWLDSMLPAERIVVSDAHILAGIAGLVYPAVWLAYLAKSHRVAATYPEK